MEGTLTTTYHQPAWCRSRSRSAPEPTAPGNTGKGILAAWRGEALTGATIRQ